MGLLKRLAIFLGLTKDEELDKFQENGDSNFTSSSSSTNLPPFGATNIHRNRKGFSLPVQVPVDRGAIIVTSNDGGVQGFRWVARRLKIDEDGDVADEFFEEVTQENMKGDHKPVTKMEVKFIARPAKVRSQVLSPEGKLQHCIDNQGRLQWV
ncbi:hypothetical protein Leryth_010738 [Lithospermum erythrorhizon]|nr:hypothetical protein Leryth_010738 [Lithospermum erythrorhizon]